MNRALIVMAKRPEAGQTKTRLCPPLSGEEASDLYRCFLLDTLELMQEVGSAQPVVAYAPEDAEDYFRRLAPAGFVFVGQEGADLGERLDNVLTRCLHDGYDQVVVTDSDSPTLPASYLQRAFGALEDPLADVVLGPTEDGGYYLVGLKSPCAALFRGVAMSTATVLAETLHRAAAEGLRATCLPRWYDVDTYEDLLRLRRELATGASGGARHTRACLAKVGDRW